MSFAQAGTFPVVIRQALITESKFAKDVPNAVDVAILVEDAQGQSDWWRGELSTRYGVGNYAQMTQLQITMGDLQKLGLPNGDLRQLDALVGKQTTATVEATTSSRNGKTYHNVKYLGGTSDAPVAMDPAEAARRIQALTGSANAAPAPFAQPGQPPMQQGYAPRAQTAPPPMGQGLPPQQQQQGFAPAPAPTSAPSPFPQV